MKKTISFFKFHCWHLYWMCRALSAFLVKPINRLFKKKYKWLFLIACLFITSAFLILFKLFPLSIDLLPIGIIVCLFFMYCCSKPHNRSISQPEDFLNPVFYALGTSFGLISLIIGLHSDVFNSYDDNGDSPDIHKWFKVNEVLNFPISQARNKISAHPDVQRIDFSTLSDTSQQQHYVILIDKTESLDTLPKQDINKKLIEKIDSVFGTKTPITKSLGTPELIPAFITANLLENLEFHKKTDASISFVFYLGGNQFESSLPFELNDTTLKNSSVMINDFRLRNLEKQPADSINNNFASYWGTIQSPYNPDATKMEEVKKSKKAFIEDYFKKVKSYDHKTQPTTSFKYLIRRLSDFLRNQSFKNTKGKLTRNIHLSLISDFLNTNVKETGSGLEDIGNIKFVSLYILPGHEKGKNSKEIVINDLLKKSVILENVKTIDFQDVKDSVAFFKNLSIINYQYVDRTGNRSFFIYSKYKDFHTHQEGKAAIIFKFIKKQKNDSVYFKINSPDILTDLPVYKYEFNGIESAVGPNELKAVAIKSSNDTLFLSLPSTIKYQTERLFIEFSANNDHLTEARMISVMPLLSPTTSYFLLFWYTVFAVSMSLLLVLPNLFIFFLIKKKKIWCWLDHHILLASIPIGLGCAFFIFYYWLLFSNKIFDLLFISVGPVGIIFSSLLCHSSIASFKRMPRKNRQEREHIMPFKPWWRSYILKRVLFFRKNRLIYKYWRRVYLIRPRRWIRNISFGR